MVADGKTASAIANTKSADQERNRRTTIGAPPECRDSDAPVVRGKLSSDDWAMNKNRRTQIIVGHGSARFCQRLDFLLRRQHDTHHTLDVGGVSLLCCNPSRSWTESLQQSHCRPNREHLPQFLQILISPRNSAAATSIQGCSGVISPAIPANLTTSAHTSDTVSIIGMTPRGHCSLSAANESAAAHIASAFISSYGTGQIPVTHATAAGMDYTLLYTPN
jgi:hypothetical protein